MPVIDTIVSDTPLEPQQNNSLPTGTVYLLGYSDTFVDGRSLGDLPACEPCGYFYTPEDVIRYASKEFCADGTVESVPLGHDKCQAYRIFDQFLKRPVFIYVWALKPAGGAL